MKIDSPQAILQELKRFRQMGSVLYIAAHPDDENTELLAYLSRGRNYRTAYLSLTRGDGGQNVRGSDLGEKLGVARTQELLAARQIDGAQQYFSRAVDFGFSKNYLETLQVWSEQDVLSDMVRVIRQFRPDVLITRFSPSPGGTHGHHTASAVIAVKAFKLAGDPKAFPEQGLAPWQPKRIFWNISTFQREKAVGLDALKIDAGGNDALSGESFTEIAEKSRSMHKTQGFDTFHFPNAHGGERIESFHLLDGEAAPKDIMDGVDTSWNRVTGAGGAAGQESIESSIDKIISQFDPGNSAASVPALLDLRKRIAPLTKDTVVKEKLGELDRSILACLGLKVETTTSTAEIVPGEHLNLQHQVSLGANVQTRDLPLRWLSVRHPATAKDIATGIELTASKPSLWDSVETLPPSTPLTQPYWLRAESTPGLFHVEDQKLIGTPENEASFPVEYVFKIGDQIITVKDEPVKITTSPKGVRSRQKLNVIPPLSLRFTSDVALFTPKTAKTVAVEIVGARANLQGSMHLDAPPGWKIEPQHQAFKLKEIGGKEQLTFAVTAPEHAATSTFIANAEVNGVHYRTQRQEVSYEHLPPQLLQPPAVLKAVCIDLKLKGTTVGYLPGAGDSLAENLQEMGYKVKALDDAKLKQEDLNGLAAVVLGVRAFNVRDSIGTAMPLLLQYVDGGGTLIVQYNRPDKLKAEKIAPYRLHISADRVTDEKATMSFLEPDSPVLNTPNKITSHDFDGWVQERGLYFPDQWDEHFAPILACNDPGEAPSKGVLLVARYGKGHYVYTGLSLFRQLPAGVPGAYRLLANLIGLSQ
ncbi:MAG: PIG-L family deacetylase [Cyanobacteria bacterium SZAS LIN-3]|nr:PIG-L family deacetylase [Cyanobacteria bacterium SZAS LIN-3]